MNGVGPFVGTPFTLPHLDESKAGLADIVTDLAGVLALLIERLAAAVIVAIIGRAAFTSVPPM